MAGLLDYVFNSPEGRMGLGLLALGQMPKSQGMAGLMGLLASQDAAAKNKADSAWQEEARGRQRKEWDQADAANERAAQMDATKQRFFFGDGGLLGAGSVGGTSAPAVQGAGVIPAGGGAQAGGKIREWSEKLGIPQDAIVADFLQNGGKGIADMLYKRGTPDMQVTNGYAYDKNKLGSGFMPSLQTSQDGKSTMTRIGPDGLPVVSAPQGAMETYAGYQGTQAAFKPIKVYNPATGREEYTNEGAVARGQTAQPQYSGPGYAGGSAAAAAPEQLRIMQSELDRLPANHPDRPAIMREMQRLGGGQVAQSGNFAAGPSAAEVAANEAAKTRAVETAKADVVRDTSQKGDSKKFAQMTSGLDRAIELLEQQPTGSGVGAVIDKGLGSMGMSTRGGVIASQLETLSGWLTSNVPRMEGPQSNFDVENYKTMAGMVGDRTKPIDSRLAAAREAKRLQEKYAEINGVSQPATQSKQPVKTGMYNGRKVVKYSDGSVDYAD